jgi:hypothetical protein
VTDGPEGWTNELAGASTVRSPRRDGQGSPEHVVALGAPAGLETFFAGLAELMATMPPDMAKLAAFNETYGLPGRRPAANSTS